MWYQKSNICSCADSVLRYPLPGYQRPESLPDAATHPLCQRRQRPSDSLDADPAGSLGRAGADGRSSKAASR